MLSWSVNLQALAVEPGPQLAAKERLHLLIEAADVTRHAPPIRADAAVAVGCIRDGYVLANEVSACTNTGLEALYAGSPQVMSQR